VICLLETISLNSIFWDELDLFSPLPTCSCDNGLVNVSKYKMQDQIIKFLRGLNDNYLTLRTQILLMDPLLTLKKVYSLVIQQERQIFGDQSKAMITNSGGGYKNSATTYGRDSGYGRGSHGRGSISKVCSERQGIPLIHIIESMVFHLISTLKIRTMIRIMLMQFLRM